MNMYVGVMLAAVGIGTGQSIVQAVVSIAAHRKVHREALSLRSCGSSCFLLPGIHRLLVEHLTHLSTAIDLIDLSTCEQVHLSILCPCSDTESSTIDG